LDRERSKFSDYEEKTKTYKKSGRVLERVSPPRTLEISRQSKGACGGHHPGVITSGLAIAFPVFV